jgi:DNA primase
MDRYDDAQCFPIRDRSQRLWGVVRRWDGEVRSIYRYPKGFDKKSLLLGEDYPAREGIRDVWLVEGITDICSVESHLPVAAVALGGANASDEQLKRLRSYDSVTLCLDDDEAGWKETWRLMRLLPYDELYVAEYDESDPGKSESFYRYPAYEFV